VLSSDPELPGSDQKNYINFMLVVKTTASAKCYSSFDAKENRLVYIMVSTTLKAVF